MRRRVLLTAAVLLPAACATTPEPAAPPRRFGIEQFYTADPALLRAAVQTDVRVLIQAVDLNVSVQAPQVARYVIRLQRRVAVDPRLPAAPAGQGWQAFALTAEDAVTLVTVRQLLLSQPGGRSGAIDVAVSAQPALVPADLIGALPLRIDMLVDNRDGWFTQVGPLLLDTRQTEAVTKG